MVFSTIFPWIYRHVAHGSGCLADAEPFDVESLDQLLHGFVEREEIKMGQIIHALRVAVTGKGVGFGMFEILAILGRERCLRRIDRALELSQV